jgi:hypothetical protein
MFSSFCGVAFALDSSSAEALGPQPASALRDFRGDGEPLDDQTIIVMRRTISDLGAMSRRRDKILEVMGSLQRTFFYQGEHIMSELKKVQYTGKTDPWPAGENVGLREDAFTETLVELGVEKNMVTAASSSPAASIDQTPPP